MTDAMVEQVDVDFALGRSGSIDGVECSFVVVIDFDMGRAY